MKKIHEGRRARRIGVCCDALESRLLLAGVDPAIWATKHADMYNTGRADYEVPAARMNETFFDVFLWQARTPGSPGEGNFSSTAMVFCDDAGPDGSDLVVGGYHWPKGVQGMDRHTGQLFWSGNPDGGESIGTNTPAFSNDGSALYVTNDATPHPLMGFDSVAGPSSYWHNGADADPDLLGPFSPIVAPDGRVFLHRWDDGPYAAVDDGSSLSLAWSAQYPVSSCFSQPALYDSPDGLQVIATGRGGWIVSFDGDSGLEVWATWFGQFSDADPTVDPISGNVYLPAGGGDVHVVGLAADGTPLWDEPAMLVHDSEDGQIEPQQARSAGALSHDGSTYYFQTTGHGGEGRLYAINTSDGSVKWSFDTNSAAWEMTVSSPIVTRNGVIIVGNNLNDTYFAIHDAGAQGVLLDTLAVDPAGEARASATLSPDGVLYLPLRIVQSAGAGDELPTSRVENVFSAIDISEEASVRLHPPSDQRAFAGNHAVALRWTPLPGAPAAFGHYAIYRDTAPFSDLSGMTPIAMVADVAAGGYADETAENAIGYYYAVTAVSDTGTQVEQTGCIGPRTPRDETDLQVVSISRSPQYSRHAAEYSWHEVTEPSGYGPYGFSASTSLGGGQTFDTQRFPNVGDPVTYTATVRNRGTNRVEGEIAGYWQIDGQLVASPAQVVSLGAGDTAQFGHILPWDDQPHEIAFTIDLADARPENNRVVSDALAVPFLTYIDASFVETFREVWPSQHSGALTDDIIDWLNMHAARFNELFAEAGVEKRVHYDVLQVLDDIDADPPTDTSPYAIFPYRYHHTDGDPRLSGYYHNDDDIDYGLLHEMAHQLGLIDIYQLDVPPEANWVSGQGYSAVECLMHGCSPFLSEHSALAMQLWLREAHGYFGQYLYNIPQTIKLRILGYDGQPLRNATVKMYQYAERPGVGKVISDQIKAQGTTDENGFFILPNVPIDPEMVPAVGTGDALRDNPFGYVAVVGTNGLLHFRVEHNGGVDYAWLDITEANVAYFKGDTVEATFDRQLALGGLVQNRPPIDMAENNAGDWADWVQGGTGEVTLDTTRTVVGGSSVRFDTDGGFDNYIRYPRSYTAHWDLSAASVLNISFRSDNPNFSFQNASPWIRLMDADGNYFEYQYYSGGWPSDLLNETQHQWQSYSIPLNASADETDGWRRTTHGAPDLSHMQYLEIHADTWGSGFSLWIDGVGFDLPMPSGEVVLAGTSGDDVWHLRQSEGGQSVEVFENVPLGGSPNYLLPIAELLSLHIDGQAGVDTLALLSGLPFTPTFNLGGDGDLLEIRGGEHTLDDLSSQADFRVTIGGSAVVQVKAGAQLASLALEDQACAVVSGQSSSFLATDSLMMGDGTSLDVGQVPLVVRNSAQLAALTGRIRAGREDGTGLVSSDVEPGGWSALAIALNDRGDGQMIRDDLPGLTLLASDILVLVMPAGDVNFDGLVNGDDYFMMDLGCLAGASRYQQGNIDCAGVVDGGDYLVIDHAFITFHADACVTPAAAAAPGAPPLSVPRETVWNAGAAITDELFGDD